MPGPKHSKRCLAHSSSRVAAWKEEACKEMAVRVLQVLPRNAGLPARFRRRHGQALSPSALQRRQQQRRTLIRARRLLMVYRQQPLQGGSLLSSSGKVRRLRLGHPQRCARWQGLRACISRRHAPRLHGGFSWGAGTCVDERARQRMA